MGIFGVNRKHQGPRMNFVNNFTSSPVVGGCRSRALRTRFAGESGRRTRRGRGLLEKESIVEGRSIFSWFNIRQARLRSRSRYLYWNNYLPVSAQPGPIMRPYTQFYLQKKSLSCVLEVREKKRSFGSTPAKTAWEAQEVTAGSTWIGKYIVRYINVEIKSFFSFSKKEFAPKSALKVCFES